MGKGIKRILEIISEAIFPSNIYCICCGSLIDSSRSYSLCDKCIRKFHWITGDTCSKCGKALPAEFHGNLCYDCMQHEHHFDRGYSCLTYGFYERQVMMDFKYNNKGYLGEKLGDILYDRISLENLEIDVIIAVPVSRKRLKKRGYNQSELMARRLGTRMNVAVDSKSLIRKMNTKLLRTMSPAEREIALKGAFGISPKANVKRKRILLIDDIYTTGATADACSKVLKDAGALEVVVLSLASGGNRKPEEN